METKRATVLSSIAILVYWRVCWSWTPAAYHTLQWGSSAIARHPQRICASQQPTIQFKFQIGCIQKWGLQKSWSMYLYTDWYLFVWFLGLCDLVMHVCRINIYYILYQNPNHWSPCFQVAFSTPLCFTTSRRTPPSPPPTMSTCGSVLLKVGI